MKKPTRSEEVIFPEVSDEFGKLAGAMLNNLDIGDQEVVKKIIGDIHVVSACLNKESSMSLAAMLFISARIIVNRK
jgi:hypothetical protein